MGRKQSGWQIKGMTWCVTGIAVLCAMAAKAQDTRQVTEPTIPASCTQLPAQLRSVGDKLAEEDESKLDTARIQSCVG